MAVSGVKARLMLFETAESNNMVAERKDSKGEPPALQRFRLNQQQLQENKNEGQSSTEGRPPVAQKPGQLHLRQNSKTEAEPTDSDSANVGGGSGTVGKLNVAKLFMQGEAPPPLKPVVPYKKPGTFNSENTGNTTSPNAERPKVALKPPNKGGLLTSSSSPGFNSQEKTESQSTPKPSVMSNGGAIAVNDFSATPPVKLPSIGSKPLLKKTESSTSSASSSSSESSKLSSSSLTSDNTNGPIDFRKLLKPRPSLGGNTNTASNNENTTKASTDFSPSEPSEKPDSIKRSSSPDSKPADEIVERKSDCKRFKKVKLSSLPPATDEAPQKPELPEGGVDLALLCKQHAKTFFNICEDDFPPPLAPDNDEGEDIYDDGTSTVEVRPQAEKLNRNRDSGRVSMIPEMTAEDEGFDDVYDDGMTETQDEILYIDAASDTKPAPQQDEEFDDIYEDDSDMVCMREESEEAKKKRLKEEADALKREQKRKKDEEKKKKQEEKEELARRKKFNLTGNETNVGEGVIKEDAKGRGNNLTVKKGDKIVIIRTDNNPANKFLVKTDSKMGYVDSNNIEIDPGIIRQMMEKGQKGSKSNPEDENQEFYSDVPEENAAEPLEEEDIYQCVE